MTLLDYWPNKVEVDKCIKQEAESVSDAVLLAVHQEFPLAYSRIGADGRVMPDSKVTASESELLDYLLDSAPEGTRVVPITGASGVGKSHLVKILAARIAGLPNAEQYLVIRIPKDASLRRVVELILQSQPLQGAEYDVVRDEFGKALADLPLNQAVILFQAKLEIALSEYENLLKQQLTQDPRNRVIKERLRITKELPSFLADASTESYFRGLVFPRVIQRSVEGVADLTGIVDPNDSQFKAEDFNLPDSVKIDEASLRVKRFYLSYLSKKGGEKREIATDVLNSVVNQAIQQLYSLNESLGGKTLGEVSVTFADFYLRVPETTN